MSEGRKTGGRNFQKGVSGNPAGSKPGPRKTTKEFQKTNLDLFNEIASEAFARDAEALIKTLFSVAKDPENKQCIKAQEIVYERVIGKPRPFMDEEIQQMPQQVISLSIEELSRIAATAQSNQN
jgi:hypothetical protein